MTYNVLMGTLNPTHSLTRALTLRGILAIPQTVTAPQYDGSGLKHGAVSGYPSASSNSKRCRARVTTRPKCEGRKSGRPFGQRNTYWYARNRSTECRHGAKILRRTADGV